ncbi:MAG: hypothetical protein ACE5JK_04670 [Candidatus Omnitrophota bacterium]
MENIKFYKLLDKTVDKSGVRDASNFPVHNFPYLRANRFLAGFKKKVADEGRVKLWIELMRQLDLNERKKEIQNLPDKVFRKLCKKVEVNENREAFFLLLLSHSEDFIRSDEQKPKFFKRVINAVIDPGVYSLPMRVLGLYPVAYIFAALGTKSAYNEIKEWFKKPVGELEVKGKVQTFTPAERKEFPYQNIYQIFDPSRRNALKIPELIHEEIKMLTEGMAPTISIDIADDYDKFGEVKWKDGHVTIDHDNPTVYDYTSYTFFKGEPVLQINYVFWYSARAGSNVSWIKRGSLDGMTVRITLDGGGFPVMMDVMNNCGFYFFYVPRKEKIDKIRRRPFSLAPLVPAWLSDSFPHKPLKLRINTGWHRVQHIDTGEAPADARPYKLVPYETLETLPHPDGHTESVFNSQGLMKDSKRIEPYIFFSVGIPKVGYMRQRGNHAIKLAGHAHFTDPNLYERDFVFK